MIRAYLGGRVGPLYVRSENLIPRRTSRRRTPNAWTWLVLFPLLLMWYTAKGLGWLIMLAWRAARR